MNNEFDPHDPKNHGKPLWVVYGADSFPKVVCVKLLAYSKDHGLLPVGWRGHITNVWGFSVYEGEPGFRTLGMDVDKWVARESHPGNPSDGCVRWFETQAEALECIRRLTDPGQVGRDE